jgi:hypothetical protein
VGIDDGVINFNHQFSKFNKERLTNDHSNNFLKDSSNMCNEISAKLAKVYNLELVLNNGGYIEGLVNLDDVYSCKASFMEEVLLYHKNNKISGGNFKNINHDADESDYDSDSVVVYTE